MRFQDQVVLVTGSSRNTGLEIAERFLAEGAQVVLHGSRKASVAQGADRLRARGYSRFLEQAANLGSQEELDRMFKEIRREYGRLDVLVNNAIDLCCGYTLDTLTWEVFSKAIEANVTGTFYISQQAVKIMKEQGHGVIVNFSSNVSRRAIRDRIAYCASKGGIDGLTIAMALDLAPFGIRVNSVAPGYIYTDRWEKLSDDVLARRRKNVPLGRESTGETIAKVVMFLASNESSGMTGERIVVDGGCTRQLMPQDVDV
ncbi:MAG: SDR family oxidoreductase [Planctomycetia bacterium]|nr:SDR family oxidoreductase [Planctomycetia bacterium]